MKASSYSTVKKVHPGGYLDYRFGPNFAQISVDTTLKLKSSMKDVARMLHGRVPDEIEAITKKLPVPPQGISDDAFVYGYEDSDGMWVPGLAETDPFLVAYTKQYPKDWSYVKKCLGVVRSKGRHACLLGTDTVFLFDEQHQTIVKKEIRECHKVTVPTGQGAKAEATLLYQGMREVVEYALENGGTIRCTPDHKVLTTQGWMEIQDALREQVKVSGYVRGTSVILSAKPLGVHPVYDLSVDHPHHSFVHGTGVVVHNCAYVIADEPVSNFIPLTRISDVQVTQYNASSVEAVGGLKMDFLVIKVLKTLSGAVKLIQERHLDSPITSTSMVQIDGRAVKGFQVIPHKTTKALLDLWALPEDQAVFKDICEGNVEAVFQFDAPAARAGLRHFNSIKETKEDGTVHMALDSIEALAAFTSLDRPGPLDAYVTAPDGSKHNMLVEYARRARGEEAVGTLPIFSEFLPETYGVMCQQEQLQKMYQVLTGCTGSEAEEFRSNVAKKKQDKIEKAYPFFVERAGAKIGEQTAKEVFELFRTFGQYGFNKSHAVSYVTIGYACAYLKHYYPLEFWTAVLTNATKDEVNDEFWAYCSDLIDLPDISWAGEGFVIQSERIRAPLSLLHGIGETASAELARVSPGARTIEDFLLAVKNDKEARSKTSEAGKTSLGRSALNRRLIYSLIISGAFNSLFPSETSTLEQLAMYEAAVAAIESIGKKRAKKAKPVDERFVNLNARTRYQLKKSVLPAFTAKTLDVFGAMEGLDTETHRHPTFKWFDTREGDTRLLQVVGPKDINKLETHDTWGPSTSFTVAVPAYVISDERRQFGPQKKWMAKLIVDVDGARYTWVKWSNRAGQLPPEWQGADFKGSLVMLVVTKFAQEKPFSIDDLVMVEPPFNLKVVEESKEDSES